MLLLRAFVLKRAETTQALPKNDSSDFENSHPLRDRQAFMVQSLEMLNVFIILPLKQVFLKNANLF